MARATAAGSGVALAKKRLSTVETRAFRHKVSLLKKAGVVSNRIDARKQKPTRYFQDKVKRLAPVLEGRALGVKVRPDFLRTFREAGFAVENRRVIVKPEPGEILKARRGLPEFEKVIAPAPSGGGPRIVQRRLILPASVRNIHQLLDDFRARPDRWNALKRQDDRFAFTFMGGRSRSTFDDVESLADYLEMYEEKFDGVSDETETELWESLEFLGIGEDESWHGDAWKAELRRRRSANRSDVRHARERGPSWRGEQMRKSDDRDRKRAMRLKMSETAKAEAREKDRIAKATKRQSLDYVEREYMLNNQRRREINRGQR